MSVPSLQLRAVVRCVAEAGRGWAARRIPADDDL